MQVGLEKKRIKYGLKFASSILFTGLPLEAKGDNFRLRLSHAASVVAPALQLQFQCPADPQACPELAQKIYHPVVGMNIYCPILVGCLSMDNTDKPPNLLQSSVWTKPPDGMQLFK